MLHDDASQCTHQKQNEAVQLAAICVGNPQAFRSSEIERLLLDLDPYGDSDSLGMFSLFLKRTADVLTPRLSVVFRRIIRFGSFPACWRQANAPLFKRVHRPPLLPTTDRFP